MGHPLQNTKQKNNLTHSLYKMDHRSKCKMIKLLEDNRRENLHDLESGKEFLAMTSKVSLIKETN